MGSLASCVTTDYTAAELADTALALKDTGVTVYSAACPSYSFGEGGISYVGTMYDEWRAMMQRVDAGLDPADESAEIPEPQASDEDLGAATNARAPLSSSLDGSRVGNFAPQCNRTSRSCQRSGSLVSVS